MARIQRPVWVTCEGTLVKKYLKEQKMSQALLAESLGVSTRYLNGVLNGRFVLTDRLARDLSTLLGGNFTTWKDANAEYRDKYWELVTHQSKYLNKRTGKLKKRVPKGVKFTNYVNLATELGMEDYLEVEV